ncbi:MAG: exopolyphosphatase [Rhodothermales bacterium]
MSGLPKPIATIDVGTNTALLLVSSWNQGELVVLHDETRFVRLGQGVDAAGIVNQAAMQRLTDTLSHYNKVIEKWEVSTVIIGATSASRDAANKDALIKSVKEKTGLTYRLLSGLEEAEWSFAGVGAGIRNDLSSILTIDIGGGSTEFTLGHKEGGAYIIDAAQSLNVGSVRLMEKFFVTQPPTQEMLTEARHWLLEQLALLQPVYRGNNAALIGASGTTTTLASLKAPGHSATATLKSVMGTISEVSVQEWCDRLLGMNIQEVLALNPNVMKGREDVFPAGVFILRTIMEYLDKELLHVNTWGLRHGLALRYWRI